LEPGLKNIGIYDHTERFHFGMEACNYRSIEHLPALRDKIQSSVIDNYVDIQQDILETFIDRGQLQHLAKPTVTASGRTIPGLMHALVRSPITAANTSSTGEIHPP
jgi:hypothetical protein